MPRRWKDALSSVTLGLATIPLLIWLRHRTRGGRLSVYKFCILAILGAAARSDRCGGLPVCAGRRFVSGSGFSAVLLKEHVSASRVFGALIMFGGLSMLVGVETTGAHKNWLVGTGLFVAAGIIWGGCTVLLRLWQVPLFEGTSVIASFGVMFAVLALGPAAWPSLNEISTAMLFTQIVMQVIVGGILSVIALVAALQRLTAQTAACKHGRGRVQEGSSASGAYPRQSMHVPDYRCRSQ
ncbi:hypothetical protein RLO149_c039760 [Roseobacter litoralis Och 149]|uniref:EamA domain-containing protein n=1 Tax=Roseobacter litoralis (strain ATCC 49566 / DSM 6996 / JCM 21268 / NBRC 15278 / OCh 149) TaxID=391595 RepID=F7ZEI1_ROSLO|nr:hypothetical protein RLO149_c039760 [Roseobacter litoralis Och 149]